MKLIKLYDQDGNRSVGIWQGDKGVFTAMTFSQSKSFKSIEKADAWLNKYL